MTILFLTSNNPFATEGASANRWRTIIEGLALHNVDIELFIVGGWQSKCEKKDFKKRGKIPNYSNIRYNYILPVNDFNLWQRRINRYIIGRILIPFITNKVNAAIRKSKSDYIFIQPYLNVFKVFSLLNKKYLEDRKIIMEINEFNDAAYEHATNILQVSDLNKYNRLLSHNVLPGIDILIVMTRVLANHFKEFAGIRKDAKIYHMPMTVDLGRFENITESTNYEKPYIAYNGSSSFKKDGLDILIKSFNKIKPEFPYLKLYIAAYFENDGEKLIDLINLSPYKESIVFLGSLNRDEIPAFVGNAEICVLPRPASKQAEGGFPTKLGEYLATGNPVCATKVGEIPDYLKDDDSVFFAEPGSVESFANAMRRALRDPREAKVIGANGRKMAEIHFNKDILGKKLNDFLLK